MDKDLLLTDVFTRLNREVSKRIVGQEDLIRDLLICILCEGHALIQGVPGLGKTLMVRAISQVLDLKYSRIQFTPDLMPADILGTHFINNIGSESPDKDPEGVPGFKFYRGPVFGQIILADEINRATPKTQSALLEAMEEGHVTLLGQTHELEKPFVVLATQNPLEMEGTYPLPEAQVDRFLFKLMVRYPDREGLSLILDKNVQSDPPQLEPLLTAHEILTMIPRIKQVPIADHVKKFAVELLMGTHPDNEKAPEEVRTFVRFGASPRGLLAMVRAAKARALIAGRYNVAIDDIRAVALPALRHRLILNLRGIAEGINPDTLIIKIIQSL